MPTMPLKRTKSTLSIRHSRSRNSRQESDPTVAAEEATHQEPVPPRAASLLTSDRDLSDSNTSASSGRYSNKRQRSPRTSEYRTEPTSNRAEKYSAILNDLTEQRLNLPELLSLVCAGQNLVQYARKFRDLKDLFWKIFCWTMSWYRTKT
jgi:glutamate/tyrosine decarboxylase-like PLP-dependent enzyme